MAKGKIRRVDLYPDDFLTGTAMLDDAEFGLYCRACFLIYATGGTVSVDHLRAISKSHGNVFNRCLKRLRNLGKLIEKDDGISNERCEIELGKARQRIEEWKENPPPTRARHARGTRDSIIQESESPIGGNFQKNGKGKKEESFGPLRDPVEIAKSLGLRK